MTLARNLLIICGLIILLPTAAATLLLIVSMIWTAISDVRSRGRMHRSLDELLRERS